MYRSAPSPAPLVLSAFDGKVAAYDRTNGQTVWVHEPAAGTERSFSFRPTHLAVEGERAFVLTAMRKKAGMLSETMVAEVTALEYLTGRPIWSRSIDRNRGPGCPATMLVEGDQVLVAHYDVLFALSAESGNVLWSRLTEHGGGPHVPAVEIALPNATSKLLT
jgi:outer membrane protein assembly factor BamB